MDNNNNQSIGISDLGIYIPSPCIESEYIVNKRGESNPELKKKLERAKKYTGQINVRFPESWEDTATMAAQSSKILIDNNKDLALENLRYIVAGTETTVDHSKPVAAYVQGMLNKSGINVPESLTTFQIQHACASGTLSLISVAALIAQNKQVNEKGLVICSDIARYQSGTTGEITQGAGSVSLLVEKSPKLIELDFDTIGYNSKDVDDFFRPIGSNTARVKGQYSIRCYRQALEGAFIDHCKRIGESPENVLKTTDLFSMHVPYYSLPYESLRALVIKHLGLKRTEASDFLSQHRFQNSIEPARNIGNLYSGSMFMSLAFLLADHYNNIGNEIVGKKIVLASYGSGNTMVVISGKIAPGAPEVIKNWDLESINKNRIEADFNAYENWMRSNLNDKINRDNLDNVPNGSFYLNNIREDGYREYLFKK